MAEQAHAPPLQPIRKQLVVAGGPARAFRLFTRGIGEWWPRHTRSVRPGESAAVHLEGRAGGRLYEVLGAGEEAVWGSVLVWEPPRRLVFTFHPGRAPETAQEVEITFAAAAAGTLVSLEHRGWERLGADAAQRMAGYMSGWDDVFGTGFGDYARGQTATET